MRKTNTRGVLTRGHLVPALLAGGVAACLCGGAAAQPLIRIAQESAPAQGDFDSNIVAVVAAWDRSTTVPGLVYNYGNPIEFSWNGDLLDGFGGIVADRSHIMFARTAAPPSNPRCQPGMAGVSLFWVHDRSGNSDGGSAKTLVRVIGSTTAPCRAIQDGEAPPDVFANDPSIPGEVTFSASNTWDTCCTDGYTIDHLNGSWRLELHFGDYPGSNPGFGVLAGLRSWDVYSADGVHESLTLQTDRRAEARPLEPCEAVLWPSRRLVCPTSAATFTATSSGGGPASFQWQFRGGPAADWVDLADGSNTAGGEFLLVAQGAQSASLTVDPGAGLWQFGGSLRCLVTNDCGSTLAEEGTLAICSAEWNCDGAVNSNDISAFLTAWLDSIQSENLSADFNGDGTVNSNDISAFLTAWLAAVQGGC